VKLKNNHPVILYASAALLAICAHLGSELHAAAEVVTERQIHELQKQNQALQEQLKQQQPVIDSLTINKIEDAARNNQVISITVLENGEARADLVLGFANLPKP